MEVVQGSKTKPRILSSENNFKTTVYGEEGGPVKCAEVYQSYSGGLWYVCLFCGEDFTKALQLEDHLLEHLVQIDSINNTYDHRSHIEESDEDTCEQLEITEVNEEDFGDFVKIESSETEHIIDIIEDDVMIKDTWFTKSIKCDNCDEMFSCFGLQNQHRREQHNIPHAYDCQLCNAGFNDVDKYMRHKELHGTPNNPTCAHCQQIFEFQSDLVEHFQQSENTETEIYNELSVKNPKQRYPCQLCGKTFGRPYSLNRHFKRLHKEIWLTQSVQCEDCGASFNCQGLQRQHRRQKHNISFPYDCQQCIATFDKKDRLTRHQELHGTLYNPTCKYCKQIFEFQSDLNDHFPSNSGVRSLPQRYSCQFCDKTFAWKDSLSRHFKRVHKETCFTKRVECTDCGDTFSCQGLQRQHRREKHNIFSVHNCQLCNAGFNTKDRLEGHKELHRTPNNPACQYCQQIFEFQSDLIEHYQQNDNVPTEIPNEPKGRYPCRSCGKTFPCKQGMLKHFKKHSERYCCNICPYKTKVRSYLSTHMRYHTGEWSYSCDMCDRKFRRLIQLNEHKRTHSVEIDESIELID